MQYYKVQFELEMLKNTFLWIKFAPGNLMVMNQLKNLQIGALGALIISPMRKYKSCSYVKEMKIELADEAIVIMQIPGYYTRFKGLGIYFLKTYFVH